jgi:hypothetical protein
LPITKQTLDDLTFEEYLGLIRQRGYRLDADDLERSIPAELGIPYEKLAGETWGSIMSMLMKLRGDLIAEAIGPMMGDDGDEALIGGALPPEKAVKILAEQNADWAAFKAKTESSIRG